MIFNEVSLTGLPDGVKEINLARLSKVTSAAGQIFVSSNATYKESWVSFTPDRKTVTGGEPFCRVSCRLPIIPEPAVPGVVKIEGKLAFTCGRPLFECDVSAPDVTAVPGGHLNWGLESPSDRYLTTPGPISRFDFKWNMTVTKSSPGASLTESWWAYPAGPDERRRKGFSHPSWPVTFDLPAPFQSTFSYHSGTPHGHGKLFHTQLDYCIFYWSFMSEMRWENLRGQEKQQIAEASISEWMQWWNGVRVKFYQPTVTGWAGFCLHLIPPPQADWSPETE